MKLIAVSHASIQCTKTASSYARLQRNVFVDHLLAFLNGTLGSPASKLLYKEYQPFANMTKSERHDFIE